MSTRSADRIDLLGIPRKGVRFSVVVPVADMKRLGGMLATDQGSVRATAHILGRSLLDVSGQGAAGRFWHMTGSVVAELDLRCERCLGEFRWPISVPINVGIVRHDRDAAHLQEAIEPHLLEGDELNALTLIEDELILSMPPIPVHPSVEECGESVAALVGPSDPFPDASEAGDLSLKRENPFAVLASLKTGADRGE